MQRSVIAGCLGTRCDDIRRETNIRNVGATCVACGFRPEIVAEPSVNNHFRPGRMEVGDQRALAKAESGDHAADLAQDTDAKP